MTRGNLLRFVIVVLLLGSGSVLEADVFNIKVLSDNTPDLTDLPSFAASATDNWTTNDEKARVLSYWMFALGDQASSNHDWEPIEPILTFNNLPNPGFCAHWTAAFIAVAEGGMGWVGRHYELSGGPAPTVHHTVPEIEYDGGRHYIDGSTKFYGLDCDGKILSIVEMDDVAGSCGIWPNRRYHNLFYHTPGAICRDTDGYLPNRDGSDDHTPIMAWITGRPGSGTVCSRIWGNPNEDTMTENWLTLPDSGRDPKLVTYHTGGTHSIYRYVLNLKDNQHYTRYWKCLDPTHSDMDYFYPTSTGGYPDKNHKAQGNGEWVFTPDLSDDNQFESITDFQRGTPAIHPSAMGTEAVAVFKVECANLLTACTIEAELYRRDANDTAVIEVSADAGGSWLEVWNNGSTGTVNVDLNATDTLKGTYAADNLRMILDYYVRVRIMAKDSVTDCGLNSITIKTRTTVNRQSLPTLRLGENLITVDIDTNRQIETKTLRPMLKNDQYLDYVIDSSNIACLADQSSSRPVIGRDDPAREAWVTFQLDAPRAISRARMGGDIWVSNWGGAATNYVKFQYKLYDGSWSSTWTDVGQYNRDTQDTPTQKRRHQTHYEQFDITTPNVTGVQFRFLFRGANSWAGSSLLRMEVDNEAADTTFKPIEVTYNWTEYYEPLPADPNSGGTTRTHTERVTCLPHKYNVNCGGDIQPRMNWIRVNLEGSSPETVTRGYSDATDHGDRYAIPQERFDYSQVLSIGKPYTQSTNPASATYGAEAGELTDGLIRFPQVEGSWPATELAHWPNGVGTLDITVDLGSAQSVGGARVDAYAYSPSDVRFPYSVEVQTSIDGTTFTSRGTDRHKGARYAHNNWNVDWPLYPRHDSPDWDVFPDYGLRGNYIFVPFDAPVSARYVKFLVTQTTGKGLMLSEVNVYDRLTAEEWTPRLTHEPSLTAPVAYVDVDQVTGHAPMTVNFDAAGSSDPDGGIVSYVWDFGDTNSGTGASVSHTYNSAGAYTVTLTVTDNGANESQVTTYVSVAESRP